MNLLILMMGIPASGKSTAVNRFFSNATIISPDSYIGYSKDRPWSPQSAKEAWILADQKLEESLRRKDKIIVFDATFTKPKIRKKYIKLGNLYKFDVFAFYCYASIKVACDRNSKRKEFRKVPEFIVKNMKKNFILPSKEEGFKSILTFDSISNKLEGKLSKEEKKFLDI